MDTFNSADIGLDMGLDIDNIINGYVEDLERQIFYCESCKCELKKQNKKRHLKSMKHRNNINNDADWVGYYMDNIWK